MTARPVVFVHIGLPKTGTTYLQDRLWRNRDIAMRTGRLLYPGVDIADHFHAAVHLQADRYLDWVDAAHAGSWPRMVAQMRAWPGTSIVSHELLATATAEHVRSMVSDLDFADVHVIATVRDLARQIPSVWQENVKNQRTATLDEFVTGLRDLPRDEQEPFWEFQDHVAILRRWADVVDPEFIHLVTVPRVDRSDRTSAPPPTLWSRFCGLIGVDADALDRTVPPSNTALDRAQTEMIRRLNEHLQPDRIAWDRYEGVVKRHLIGDVLFGTADRRGRVLEPDQLSWAAAESDRMIADIEASGFDVVGDLTDLRVPRGGASAGGEPPLEETLDTTIAAFAEVLRIMPSQPDRSRIRTRVKSLARRVHRRAVAFGMRRASTRR